MVSLREGALWDIFLGMETGSGWEALLWPDLWHHSHDTKNPMGGKGWLAKLCQVGHVLGLSLLNCEVFMMRTPVGVVCGPTVCFTGWV